MACPDDRGRLSERERERERENNDLLIVSYMFVLTNDENVVKSWVG